MLPLTISGVVTKFSGTGRKLGYPTANITTPVVMDDGIYFGYADISVHRRAPALIFVGTPVTVGETGRRVEAHLLDVPDKDFYGETLILEIVALHRPNQKLASIEALKTLMHQDEVAARAWFQQQSLASDGPVANT